MFIINIVQLFSPVFSHGNLYVAMSRVGNPHGHSIMMKWSLENRSLAENLVYTEILAR